MLIDGWCLGECCNCRSLDDNSWELIVTIIEFDELDVN